MNRECGIDDLPGDIIDVCGCAGHLGALVFQFFLITPSLLIEHALIRHAEGNDLR
jgi:hypothetical protein